MTKLGPRLLLILVLLAAGAAAQTTFDLAGGIGSVAANWCCSEGSGGLWTAVSGTAMFTRNLGLNADFNTHVVGRVFGDRPYLADINLAMRASPARVTPELDLGWGGLSLPTGGSCAFGLIVTPTGPTCSSSGRKFFNGGHMAISVGIHTGGGWFVRPIWHLYLGKNMGHPMFFGAMLGYSFGRR